MKAVTWHGPKDVQLDNRPLPKITEPKDAIIRITCTAICGSDIRLYKGDIEGIEEGDIFGHEFMGIVEEIGSGVSQIQVGDRVVVSSIISCGECDYCKKNLYCSCERSNPNDNFDSTYGYRLPGVFGYSSVTGGYPGGQAEFCRVPFADINLLKISNDDLRDEQVILLSDVLCTAWHANELAEIGEGKTVVIWGLGPFGLLTAAWAKFRGASKIVGIDQLKNRLALAEEFGATVINSYEKDVKDELNELFPNGPDVCIVATGFYAPDESFLQKVEKVLGLGTDPSQVLTDALTTVNKNGTVVVMGDYFSQGEKFSVGTFVGKGITMKGGQVQVQKYWKQLLNYIEEDKIPFDLLKIITHILPLDDVEKAYKIIDKKEEGVIKLILKPETQIQYVESDEL
jgi:threonine dehydrogenase-like Zn-dependent dehydrogenase